LFIKAISTITTFLLFESLEHSRHGIDRECCAVNKQQLLRDGRSLNLGALVHGQFRT